MKSIRYQHFKKCTHFLIIVMVFTGNGAHCAERQKERRRQAKISALLASSHASKQTTQETPTQKLLEESERKDAPDNLPLATLARAGARQRRWNTAYIHEVRAAVAPLPESVKQMVTDYARPEWFLDKKFKHHNERIYSLQLLADAHLPAVSFTFGKEKEQAIWNRIPEQ